MNRQKQMEIKSVLIDGDPFEYRLIHSKAAKSLRVRIGLSGAEVILPFGRDATEAEGFLNKNSKWVAEQTERVARLNGIRKPIVSNEGEMLYMGKNAEIVIETDPMRKNNRITFEEDTIRIIQGLMSSTPIDKSFENWLRKQAKQRVDENIREGIHRIRKYPKRVYIMGQRTKLGNCSTLSNISINWRLILAPEYVLKYIVYHELLHLKMPDHSNRYWLTLKSLYPHVEKAKQWLTRNSHLLYSYPPSLKDRI
jgi:predicted metal-dependent hydrolase